MEHRDSPDIEPEPADEPRSSPGRRFARMVSSPAARRVAVRRLLVAGGLALGLIALVAIGGSKLLQLGTQWVDRRPEYQIPFARIELLPEPYPWVKGGKAKILEDVRAGAKLDETVSLLDLKLDALEKDFRRYFWVKDVIRVDRSHYGRLIVELAYRKPVAVVPYPRLAPGVFVLDDEAVVLPDAAIDWASGKDPYRVQGMASPLIKIRGLPDSSPAPSYGLPWKRKVEADYPDKSDPMMRRAASLARFLQERKLATNTPGEVPDFVSIYLPDGPDEPFFLLDSDLNWVCWGKAPGDEKPDQPSSEAKWDMLRKWIRSNGPLVVKDGDFLDLTSKEAVIRPSKSAKKKKP